MVYFILTLCKSFRRVLESMAEALYDLIYLLLTDDERGAEGYAVPRQRSDNQAVLLCPLH